MKVIRKTKIPKTEFLRIREVAKNYHKYMYKRFKRVIKIKRLA